MSEFLKIILRPLEIYILSIAFIFTTAFDRNLDLENVDQTPVRDFLEIIHSTLQFFTEFEGFIGSVLLIFQFILIVWIMLGQKARLATDIFAVILSFCWILELVSMNLLLVSPILDPIFLLLELVLFIPIILLGFSWWYWRLNHQNRMGLGKESISFDDNPTAMSYFIKTACIAVNDTTEHGVCRTDTAKLIRIVNGLVVMDVFGLTLSRAVGLVIL